MSTDFHSGPVNGQANGPPAQLGAELATAVSSGDEVRANILIVDDEPRNLNVLEAILNDPGYRLVRAGSADQALLALVAEEFALLILDIRMPGMSGFELAQVIKERKKTARVPIIFLTAYYNEDQHMLEGYGTGAVDYLHKPVNATILRSKVAVFAQLYRKNRESALANRALLAEITQRRRAEEALRALNETLDARVIERSEALRVAKEAAEAANSSKDRFLAMLSHELRTPLTPALMVAETLHQDARLSAEVREQIGIIKRNIDLEARLLDDLLDMTAISKGKLRLRSELCDVHLLIGLAIQIVRNAASKKGIKIECELTASHCGLWGDPPRFQQVLWNLLRNSVKFTPRGGRIITRTSNRVGEDGLAWLVVEVSDSGIGIVPAALERIFLPFAQEDTAASHPLGGIGLGLTIARAIVEMHGGRIYAQSDGANRGATFVVELPAVTAVSRDDAGVAAIFPSAVENGPAKPAENEMPGLVRRILLVEDHPATLQTVSNTLRRWGCHVTTADNVADALKLALAHPFDLVISDLGLPDGTGIKLMEQLRAEHGLSGIALSGYGMEEDIVRSREAGFVAHLVKPIHPADLRNLIKGLSGRNNST
jgi:signal transduction histidine kinase